MGRSQRVHEGDQRVDLRWAQVLTIRWHVSAALNYLPNELIVRQSSGHCVECRTTLAAFAIEAVTISALLALNKQRALEFQTRTALNVFDGRWCTAPRLHVWRPRRERPKISEYARRKKCQHHHYDGHRTPAKAFFSGAGIERKQDENRYPHYGSDKQ